VTEDDPDLALVTPTRAVPPVTDLIKIALIAGLHPTTTVSQSDDGDQAYLAGALRAVTGLWETELAATCTEEQKDAYRQGWIDGHERDPQSVMAILAYASLHISHISQALTPTDGGEEYLVPLTLAAAAGDVSAWSLSLAAMLAEGDRDHDDIRQCAAAMLRKVSALFDRLKMLEQMLKLRYADDVTVPEDNP
jgi:hypothetical protein